MAKASTEAEPKWKAALDKARAARAAKTAARKANPEGKPAEAKPAADMPQQRRTPETAAAVRKRIATEILGGHLLIAGFFGIPEMQLSPEEGDILASRLIANFEAFGIDVEQFISGRWAAIVGTVTAMGVIYVPRIAAVARRKQEVQRRAEEAKRVPAPVPGAHGPAPTAPIFPPDMPQGLPPGAPPNGGGVVTNP